MLLKQLKALEDGTLIVISDGHNETRIIFHKGNVYERGYLYGSVMYPPSWIRIAKSDDFMKAITKLSDEFNKNLERYKKAYEIAKKQTGE